MSNISLREKGMKLSTQYGNKKIEFELEYRNRKTLAIQVKPIDKVLVLSPKGLSEHIIKEKVKSKGKWILKKLLDFKDIGYIPFNREFADGEGFMYLGRNYLLQLFLNNSLARFKVKLSDGILIIYTPTKDPAILKKLLERWYRKEAEKVILKRIEYYKPKFSTEPAKIKIKEQKRRWGSCNSRGSIYFNWRIIMAPPLVIDYIIVHEMSHLIHRNHSPKFWKQVESMLPDYKVRKKWLRDHGVIYQRL
jgi:predicted metal-dependent hydrolase